MARGMKALDATVSEEGRRGAGYEVQTLVEATPRLVIQPVIVTVGLCAGEAGFRLLHEDLDPLFLLKLALLGALALV